MRTADVVLGGDQRETAADLGALELAQAGRVAEHGAGVDRSGGTTGVGGARGADALLVDLETVCEGMGGNGANGQGQGGFKPCFFHCKSNSCVERRANYQDFQFIGSVAICALLRVFGKKMQLSGYLLLGN
ncbi:hypothetical protein D9M71_513510 [compost metagenome]